MGKKSGYHLLTHADQNRTSIHWHGLRQHLTNIQDGANGVTECPLAPGQTKTYTFRATQYGNVRRKFSRKRSVVSDSSQDRHGTIRITQLSMAMGYSARFTSTALRLPTTISILERILSSTTTTSLLMRESD